MPSNNIQTIHLHDDPKIQQEFERMGKRLSEQNREMIESNNQSLKNDVASPKNTNGLTLYHNTQMIGKPKTIGTLYFNDTPVLQSANDYIQEVMFRIDSKGNDSGMIRAFIYIPDFEVTIKAITGDDITKHNIQHLSFQNTYSPGTEEEELLNGEEGVVPKYEYLGINIDIAIAPIDTGTDIDKHRTLAFSAFIRRSDFFTYLNANKVNIKTALDISEGSSLPTGTINGQTIRWDTNTNSWILTDEFISQGIPYEHIDINLSTYNSYTEGLSIKTTGDYAAPQTAIVFESLQRETEGSQLLSLHSWERDTLTTIIGYYHYGENPWQIPSVNVKHIICKSKISSTAGMYGLQNVFYVDMPGNIYSRPLICTEPTILQTNTNGIIEKVTKATGVIDAPTQIDNESWETYDTDTKLEALKSTVNALCECLTGLRSAIASYNLI